MNRLASAFVLGAMLLVVYLGIVALTQNPYLAVAGIVVLWLGVAIWTRQRRRSH
jgi:hypothetical protein